MARTTKIIPSEDRRIAAWIKSWPKNSRLITGPGDDCALLHPAGRGRWLVLKTDAVVQDVHFKLSAGPAAIGTKAVHRVLSDFAAMGARPEQLLITVGCPLHLSPGFIQKCYSAMSRIARRHGLGLAGGETTRSRELWFNIAATGSVQAGRSPLRSGARPGHVIYVTGSLGGAAAGRHLTFTPRLREGLWLAEQRLASAMMDLSDGLGKDLPRLAAASRVSFAIETARLPLTRGCTASQAINDGEDYELLFTVPARLVVRLEKDWPFKTKLTAIGKILPLRLKAQTGGVNFRGYDHFTR